VDLRCLLRYESGGVLASSSNTEPLRWTTCSMLYLAYPNQQVRSMISRLIPCTVEEVLQAPESLTTIASRCTVLRRAEAFSFRILACLILCTQPSDHKRSVSLIMVDQRKISPTRFVVCRDIHHLAWFRSTSSIMVELNGCPVLFC
jgi:hypothetical protein